MKEVAEQIIPKIINNRANLRVIDHGSKVNLLKYLPERLVGYKRRHHEDIRVLVLVDRDHDDCVNLKQKLENMSLNANLHTKSSPDQDGKFQVVNRIVIEELESWFIGDNNALSRVFNRVPNTFMMKAKFRDPDSIKGGTWEALFRVLKKHGYYQDLDRLPKIDLARMISKEMNIDDNKSRSFNAFLEGIKAITDLT